MASQSLNKPRQWDKFCFAALKTQNLPLLGALNVSGYMKPEELIGCIKSEIEESANLYSQGLSGGTDVGSKIDALGLGSAQREMVVSLIKQAMEEFTYTLICGLEGEASVGGGQQQYKLLDEAGNELSGDLSSIFYEAVME